MSIERPSSRREVLRVLGIGAAVAAVGPAGNRAFAQAAPADAVQSAPPDAMQGGGFYRFKVGDLDCAVVSDGGFNGQPRNLFPDVGDEELAEACDKGFITPGFVPMSVNALLVRTGDATILVDTGTGGAMGPTLGKVEANLRRLGVEPEAVTHVVISHAHADHVGGLVNSDGQSRYRKARIILSEAEHAFWTAAEPAFPANNKMPADTRKGMAASIQKILKTVQPQIDLKKPGDTVAGVLTLEDAAGHTPGMVMVRIRSGDASALFVADTMHVMAIQPQHPDWRILFDTDPELGAATRKRVFAELASQRTLAVGPHLPFPAVAHLVRQGAAYQYVPQLWQW